MAGWSETGRENRRKVCSWLALKHSGCLLLSRFKRKGPGALTTLITVLLADRSVVIPTFAAIPFHP